ncbi:hypothetical protein [Conexibacter sp. CPCC 206217]|uniref:hypothetical protein n=1 Tax=Conexibacter sp. CPCC 206217 TaxID=3064574 RepID=UPI0027292EA1|nr:hypothetical protein [Conexibacter sp. CPCC 206217]MDO8211260.1 hypothetical protein [Conexibacter sp. CPCC 206217]
MTDLATAETFLTTHARLLERARLDLALGRAGAAERVLSALAAYRNRDGGFGWGLEPDQRAPSSQPAGAYQGFTVLAEVVGALARGGAGAGDASGAAGTGGAGSGWDAARASDLAVGLCDWAGSVALDGGALPFSLADAASPGTAPWWAGADPTAPSLHITAGICAHAQHVRAHDAALAAHPWLAAATDWCLQQVAAQARPDSAYELAFVLGLLDAIVDVRPEATPQLQRMAAFVPPSGELPVHGGSDDEKLRPLQIAPLPDRPLRTHFPADAIARHLAELEEEQRPDGGWTVDFPSSSPAGEMEWRGIATVEAIGLLRANRVCR